MLDFDMRKWDIDEIVNGADRFLRQDEFRRALPNCVHPARRIRTLSYQTASEFRDTCIRMHWNRFVDERDAGMG